MSIHTSRSRRRAFTVASALVAFALSVSACGGDDSDDDASSSGEIEDEIVYMGPGGGLGDVYRKALDDFAKENNIKATYVEGTTDDIRARVQAEVEAGEVVVDVGNSNEVTEVVGRALDLYQELDMSLIPNAEELAEGAVAEDHLGITGHVGAVGLAYNTEFFEEEGWDPPTSWLDLLDEKYSHCVIWQHASSGSGMKVIAEVNEALTGDMSNTADTFAGLAEIADDVPVVSAATDDATDAVEQGLGCLTGGNQGRVLEAQADGTPLAFVVPEEGGAVQSVNYHVTNGSEHPIAAQMLINYFLSEEVQSEIRDTFRAPMNVNVEPGEGLAAEVILPSQFEELNIAPIDVTVFEDLDTWVREFDTVMAR